MLEGELKDLLKAVSLSEIIWGSHDGPKDDSVFWSIVECCKEEVDGMTQISGQDPCISLFT